MKSAHLLVVVLPIFLATNVTLAQSKRQPNKSVPQHRNSVSRNVQKPAPKKNIAQKIVGGVKQAVNKIVPKKIESKRNSAMKNFQADNKKFQNANNKKLLRASIARQNQGFKKK